MIPKKLISRKYEVVSSFFELAEQHLEDLASGKAGRRLSAKDFAAQLFITPRHLTNTVKLVSGMSPCDFMENGIVQRAQKMLSDTNLSVAEIGIRFGYSEATNFIKFYKGMTGTTPLQYRKNKI